MKEPTPLAIIHRRTSPHDKSNPAPELIAWSNFCLRVFSVAYRGNYCNKKSFRKRRSKKKEEKQGGGRVRTLSKFTHVLDVGRRYWSEPASRMEKFGTSSLNPLPNKETSNQIRNTGQHKIRTRHIQQRRSTTARNEPQQRSTLFLVERVHNLQDQSVQLRDARGRAAI